jgi:4-hydroxysphinganine ceramide fatty acyl 2-hydroxylase
MSGVRQPVAPFRNVWTLAVRYREPRLLVATTVASAAALFAFRLDLRAAALRAGMAILFWFAFEYFFHRFVLHWLTPEQAGGMPFMRKGPHWRHHQDPSDLPLAFTPWWALLVLLAGTFVAGWTGASAPGAVGATLGMSAVLFVYESIHMSAHAPYAPRTKWGAMMRRSHLLHHFHNERAWFGVTHPVLDVVCRTWKRREDLAHSPTARTLGVDPAQVTR